MSAEDIRAARSAARQELKDGGRRRPRRELSEKRALVARLRWARARGEPPEEVQRIEDELAGLVAGSSTPAAPPLPPATAEQAPAAPLEAVAVASTIEPDLHPVPPMQSGGKSQEVQGQVRSAALAEAPAAFACISRLSNGLGEFRRAPPAVRRLAALDVLGLAGMNPQAGPAIPPEDKPLHELTRGELDGLLFALRARAREIAAQEAEGDEATPAAVEGARTLN